MASSTWLATPNIAVVKYWGKRDNALNLPDNGSISVTMDETLRTTTSVEFDSSLKGDTLVLNGKTALPSETARASKVLDAIRRETDIRTKARVSSENNFPTAAGIASSASGFAALACAGADAAGILRSEMTDQSTNLSRSSSGPLFGAPKSRSRSSSRSGLKTNNRQLSIFARLGSGSACRSVLGGFVEWKMGKKKDGSDSYAVQIAPASHWSELRNIIAITNYERKKIGSADGMEITTKTSKLYPERVRLNPKIIRMMKRVIIARDLENFLTLTMRESSHMHAVMLDSFPSIIYLNDISREIMRAVLEYNESKDEVCAGFTFDAGPNAHVYTTAKYENEVKKMLDSIAGVQKTIVCKPGNGPRKLN